MDYYLITFVSTHSAISSQKYLGEKIKITIMPTLREISHSCGISIRIKPEDIEVAKEVMANSSIKDYQIYSIYGAEIKKIL